MAVIQIKCAYDDCGPEDGLRILVERLWPRAVPRWGLHLDDWAHDIAPSPECCKSFGPDPSSLDTFRSRYRDELAGNPAAPAFMERVAAALRQANVTLVHASRDEAASHAAVLREWLVERLADAPELDFHLPAIDERDWPA